MMQGRPPTAVHNIHHAGRLGRGACAGHRRVSKNCPFTPQPSSLPHACSAEPIPSRPPGDLAFTKIGEKEEIAGSSGSPGGLGAGWEPREWLRNYLGFGEKLALWRYLVLGASPGCGKYLDIQGVSGCPGSSWGSGVKEAKTYI